MRKYTDVQILEFKKMGYSVNANGVVTKEVKLQKIIRTNEDTQTMARHELKSFEHTVSIGRDKKVVKRYVGNTFTRVEDWWLDEERLAKGLSTAKKPGVDYNLLPDGTKVCRCCQQRYTGSHFNVTNARKDGKSPNCKKCDSLRAKTFNEAKLNKLKK